MAWDTPYLWAIKPSLPAEYASKIQAITNSASADIDLLLDSLIRFVIGAECSTQASVQVRQEWTDKQPEAQKALDNLRKPGNTNKRPRGEDEGSEAQSHDANKRARLDDPIFTLHAISTTSPVRKKVDITIDASSIQFTHPSTKAVEATVQLSSITRAFILPTRGKQKAHWTVVLLPSDVPVHGKSSTSPPQIIFGIDAVASTPLMTTSGGSSPSTISKNSPTLPAFRSFLSHLPPFALPVLEPAASTFRSACSGPSSGPSNKVPGVEAYRAAKVGTLWFMKEGILWGESKPCEFWAVGGLADQEGVKLVSATGRTCSVYLKRRASEEDEDNEGEVCEFGMVDGREQEGIREWVRTHLGRKNVLEKKGKGKGTADGQKLTISDIDYNSDASDESFATDSENSDENSASESSSEGRGSEEEAQESEGDADGEDGEGEDDEELRPSEHPLMRPGAMPRMSRATIEAVAGMVERDFLGASGGGESEGEDELDD